MYSFSEWIAMVNFQAKLTLTTVVDTCYIFIKVHLPHPAEDKSRNKMHPYTIFRPEQLEKMGDEREENFHCLKVQYLSLK